MKKIKPFDKEEKDLMDSVENGEWVSVGTKKILKQYQEYAKSSLNKKRRINIRMTERDFEHIQIKSIQEGIPYQSLISMLIHKFNQGKLTIRN